MTEPALTSRVAPVAIHSDSAGSWLGIAWSDLAESAKEEARKVQAALWPVLTRWGNAEKNKSDLVGIGMENFRRVCGRAISARQLRRLIQRTLDRDAGRLEWTRVELFVRENPPRRSATKLSVAEQETFAELLDSLEGCAKPGKPTPSEEALIWLEAWRWYETEIEAGVAPKRAKAALLHCLSRHAAWLAPSRGALRVLAARKFSKLAHANGSAPAAMDGRHAKLGEKRADPIPQEDLDKITAHSLFNCGGRLAQGVRELVEMRGASGISSTTVDVMDAGGSKSYVNPRLREAATPLLRMAAPYVLGKQAVDDATPSLKRDYSKLRSMEVITADDYTWPVYSYLADGRGWFTLTRGQCLLFIDVRSLRILTWVMLPERNYDSLEIRTGMNTVCLEQGRPDEWYFEGGLWKRSTLVKGTPPQDWRLAQSSRSETIYGWERLGVKFVHARRARSKPAELVGGLLQNLMERCPGYCGRNERDDCPDEIKKAKLAVEAKRVHPSEHFLSFEQWEADLGKLIARYNATAQEGRILDHRSPDRAFEEFWPHDDPTVKFDPSCWHLCAHFVSERKVTKDGISFSIGKQDFAYVDDGKLGEWRHHKVLAWFDAGHPEILGVTDLAGNNPFFVERLNDTGFRAGRDSDSQSGEQYRRELAKQSGFNAFPKAVFQSAKVTFNRTFRQNIVDRKTARLGNEMLAKRNEALDESSEEQRRRQRIVRMARELQTPVETLRDFSPETEETLRRRLRRRKESEAVVVDGRRN